MRFFIFFSTFLIGLVVGRQITDELIKSTPCAYFHDDKALECRNLKISIRCNAFVNLTNFVEDHFDLFGIGTQITNKRYPLYPKYNEKEYHDYLTRQDGVVEDTFLYTSPTYLYQGIRVESSECYDKIVDILSSFKALRTITLKSNITIEPREEALIGDVWLEYETTGKTKRHWGGGWGGGWGRPGGWGGSWGRPGGWGGWGGSWGGWGGYRPWG